MEASDGEDAESDSPLIEHVEDRGDKADISGSDVDEQ